jgi:hyperosmotically inducible protein
MWNRHTDGLRIGVVTHDGHVRLQGTADSSATKELAYTLALHTRGVASVDNALVVAPAAAPSALQSTKHMANEAEREVTDAWITTKVKSTFLYSSNVDGHDIAVRTTHGVVTLTGKLGSGAERALAIELASNVRGVKSVDAAALTF